MYIYGSGQPCIYGAYIQFWPTLVVWLGSHTNSPWWLWPTLPYNWITPAQKHRTFTVCMFMCVCVWLWPRLRAFVLVSRLAGGLCTLWWGQKNYVCMRMANVPIDVLQAVCASDNGAQKITYVYEWQMLPIHKHSFLPVDVLQAVCASDNGAQKSYICI